MRARSSPAPRVPGKTHPIGEGHPSHPGWRAAAGGAIGVFFAALIVVTFPVLLRPWAAEFGWSRQAISTAFAIAAAVAALCAGPLGVVLDRVGPRRVAIPGLVLLGCALASLSLMTPRLAHLYGTFAVLGLAGISTSPVAYGRAVSSWFATRRGLALGVVITGGAVGGIVHPPLAGALIHAIGWRGACLTLGLLVLAIGVPAAARLVRERPFSSSGEPTAARSATGVRSPLLWVLAAGLFAGTSVQNGVIVHLVALLTDRGMDPARAALALSAMAGAAVTGRLATGILVDRVFAAHVAATMMALAAAGAFVLATAPSFGAAVLAAVLVGFGTGGEADVVPYLLSRYFGLRSLSSLYGLAWMVGALGGAFGPVVMGRTFDRTGGYEAALLGLAAAAAAAGVCMLLMPRYTALPARAAGAGTAES